MFVGIETCPPGEYATNAFSSEWKYENLALVDLVVKKLKNWLFHDVDLQRTAKKCTKIYNPRTSIILLI